jgi:hypothetical protein
VFVFEFGEVEMFEQLICVSMRVGLALIQALRTGGDIHQASLFLHGKNSNKKAGQRRLLYV